MTATTTRTAKKAIGLDWQKTILHAYRALLYTRLRKKKTTTWNFLSFTFFEARGHKTTTVGAAQIQFLNDCFRSKS